MLLGLISDTHGHLTELRQAARRLVDEFHVDAIVHLGDDSTDADEIEGIGVDIISVPGLFEERYRNSDMENRKIVEFDGVPVLLTHTPVADSHDRPGDINPTDAVMDGDVKAVFYGHTHHADMQEKHGAVYVNPGHLNPRDNRGEGMSFAVVEVKPQKMTVRIVELAGGVREEKMFPVG
jgi:putative phosphoesterase